jgi:diaminohydroxyphosphoribosylaminopyrimidine deaminase / 5-amino-6-(5-phosphoribosylamino)uracil reductase
MCAIAFAKLGCGHTRPNPSVGAIVVGADGVILGEGWHRKAGGDHAEVAAIKDVRAKLGAAADEKLRHSTLYVTLEPCSKAGRVGACTDAIVAAGISRVVYAVDDPNPTNRGRAAQALAERGVSCERYGGDDARVAAEAGRLIAPFKKHVETGLPFVTVKIAMSLDGRICDDYGDARWISSEEAREETGEMRAHVDAIMVGAETVRRDNPSLLCHQEENPDLIRVVVSRSGNLPKDAQVFTDGKNETLVFADAEEALRELGRRGCLHVLCEGGLNLATSLADAGHVDEWLTVLSPCIIGHRHIKDAIRLREMAVDDRLGDEDDVFATAWR